MLAMRRSEDAPRRPWTWDFPGGIVEHGEQPLESAIREAAEESGLMFTPDDIGLVDVVTHPRGDEHGVLVFYTTNLSGAQIKLSYEHDAFEWVTKEDFQRLETPDEFKQIVTSL